MTRADFSSRGSMTTKGFDNLAVLPEWIYLVDFVFLLLPKFPTATSIPTTIASIAATTK